MARVRGPKDFKKLVETNKKIRSSKLLNNRPDMLGVSKNISFDHAPEFDMNLNDYEGLEASNFG